MFRRSRASDIERWRKELENTLREVEEEIRVQREAKESCERALEAKAMPIDVATECLSLREGRREFEVVRDPVEHSLKAELKLLEQIKLQLKGNCEDSWDQINTLEDIRQRLETDLQDKSEALKIDMDQLQLTERSSGISHKPDPTRVPAG